MIATILQEVWYMATKKDNLPLTLDQDNDSQGTITYANEVIAIIAGVAAAEVA